MFFVKIMYTIKQIINNQKTYKKMILDWLSKDIKKSKKELFSIKSKDEYIQEQVIKLKDRFKKISYKKETSKLFFMHPDRNDKFYAWWDNEEQKVIILNYGKK